MISVTGMKVFAVHKDQYLPVNPQQRFIDQIKLMIKTRATSHDVCHTQEIKLDIMFT